MLNFGGVIGSLGRFTEKLVYLFGNKSLMKMKGVTFGGDLPGIFFQEIHWLKFHFRVGAEVISTRSI